MDPAQIEILRRSGEALVPMAGFVSIICALMIFLPRREWAWGLAFAHLAGMVFCCPCALMLLPIWVRPEVRGWFAEANGRNPTQ